MEEPVQDLNILMRTFNQMYHICMRQALDKQGMARLSNPKILFILRHHEQMTQKEIADHLGVAPPTVAVSVRRMEAAGLVCKTADSSDQRKNRVALTQKGLILTDACNKAGEEMHRQVMEGLEERELRLLGQCYMKMIRNLERIGARLPGHMKTRCYDD